MDEDIKVMLQFQHGDKTAFDKIIIKYQKPIINFIYRFTADRSSAEDLAQEVFIRIYNASKNYVASAKFSTWIFRITANVAIDYLRKRKAEGINISMEEIFEGKDNIAPIQLNDQSQENSEQILEKQEIEANIKKALQSLPENQRLAIVLKVYEDMPYNEIASILGVSVASVESLLFRARQALKVKLK